METQPHNPFGSRGRITNLNELFDRASEFRLLRQYLTKGISCQVVAPTGYGKSSLLYSLTKFAPEWDKHLIVAYIDLLDPRTHTVSGLLSYIRAVWETPSAQPTLAMLADKIAALSAKDQRLVLCLDEFEECARRPDAFTTDFFLDLRAIAQAGMVIVTASRNPLRILVPSNSPVSPFFNIFSMLRLGPFPTAVAEDFVSLERPGVPPFTAEERQLILNFAQGHPLSLQVACFHVLEAKRTGESLSQAMQKAKEDMHHQQLLR